MQGWPKGELWLPAFLPASRVRTAGATASRAESLWQMPQQCFKDKLLFSWKEACEAMYIIYIIYIYIYVDAIILNVF